LNRAYSVLDIKSIDDESRVITGITSTPGTDRDGDIMEPKGAQFTLPLPFLWQHNRAQPIGEIFDAKVTDKGIEIQARIAKVAEPGQLKDLLDLAWQSIKAKLVKGLSVGFRPIEYARIAETGGMRMTKWAWHETSAVTIPANADATIRTIKSFDPPDLAATGHSAPGATGTLPIVRAVKAAPIMANTIQEQITAFENTRAAKAARMNEIQAASTGAGSTKDAAQREEFDTLKLELKAIDAELVDLRELEAANVKAATPITRTADQTVASAERGGTPVISVKANVPKGISFARMCMALAAGGGDSYKTLDYAKQWKDSTPEVEELVKHMWRTKAAVAAGTTTDSTWAGPLVVTQPLNDFLELLRPRTLLGRIPGLKQVPFNVSLPSQTTGGTYGWVGQNKPKPVTKADYATVTLGFNKVAGIIVLSEELVTLSSPSAENLVRQEMLDGMAAFLDQQFCDPAVAVSAGVNPASITNGAATIASSGVTGAAAKTDLSSRVGVFVAANYALGESVWLMSEANAFGIGLSVNGLGQPLFPGFNGQNGGMLMGIPVVVSNNVGARIILAHTPSILYADEGGIRIDVSREASVQMDSAPTDTVDATTVYLSLWQRNLIGLKAERIITWKVARSTGVTYITTAASYNGT
jgi:HK97 family phage major capsid protein/HK97 family phage prohead protease